MPSPPAPCWSPQGGPGRPLGTKEEPPQATERAGLGVVSTAMVSSPGALCAFSTGGHTQSDRKNIPTLDCEHDLWLLERSEINRKS